MKKNISAESVPHIRISV